MIELANCHFHSNWFFFLWIVDQFPAGTDWVEFIYCYYGCFVIAVMIFWYLIIKPWDNSSGSLSVAFIIYWFRGFFQGEFFFFVIIGCLVFKLFLWGFLSVLFHTTQCCYVWSIYKQSVHFILSSATNQIQIQSKFGSASLNSVIALLQLHENLD